MQDAVQAILGSSAELDQRVAMGQQTAQFAHGQGGAPKPPG
jgi:hypothetical protein